MSGLVTTSTIEFKRIDGIPVKCCQSDCTVFASVAVVVPSMDGASLRLYEMQPFCVWHAHAAKRIKVVPTGR